MCEPSVNQRQSHELSRHIETIRFRSQTIQAHMHDLTLASQSIQARIGELTLEWQQLMSELQQTLAYAEPNVADHDDTMHNGPSNSLVLKCPHPECRTDRQTYSEKKSLKRHFRTHVKAEGSCECNHEFEDVRSAEIHIDKCLKKDRNEVFKRKAKARKKKFLQTARDELERALSWRGQTDNVCARTTETVTHVENPVFIEGPARTTSKDGLETINAAEVSNSPDRPSLSGNDEFTIMSSLSADLPAYSRGTLFTSNPIYWGYPHPVPQWYSNTPSAVDAAYSGKMDHVGGLFDIGINGASLSNN